MNDDRFKGFVIALVAIAATAAPTVATAQSEVELWRDGFKPAWESGYETIDGCEYEKLIKLSDGYFFECSEYNYVYHYGAVRVMSKPVRYAGSIVEVSYLCMEGEDECLEGRLVRVR